MPSQDRPPPGGKRTLRVYGGQSMNCAACGAPANRERASCQVCGLTRDHDPEKSWDRAVEAAAYEDLAAVLEPDEALLGVTRGRIMAGWRPRRGNPKALFSPFVNLGLTGSRLILQPVQPSTGAAISGSVAAFPLD